MRVLLGDGHVAVADKRAGLAHCDRRRLADNRDGQLLLAGTTAATLQVGGRLDSSGGVIATGGATTVQATDILNDGGESTAASVAPMAMSARWPASTAR